MVLILMRAGGHLTSNNEYVHTLELSEVVALLSSDSRSAKSSLVDMAVKISTAFSVACWNDSAITVGWRPVSESCVMRVRVEQCFKNSSNAIHTLQQQLLRRIEQASCENNDRGRTVTGLNVLCR